MLQGASLRGLHVPSRPENFLATSILGIQSNLQNIQLQSLTSIVTYWCYLWPFRERVRPVFQYDELEYAAVAKLPWLSRASMGFLLSGDTFKWKSFKIDFDWFYLHRYEDFDEAQKGVIFVFGTVSKALKTFSYWSLSFSKGILSNRIVDHQSTLKRLAVYETEKSKGSVVDGSIPCYSSRDLLFDESQPRGFGTGGPIPE